MLNTILANKIPEKIQKSIKFWIDLLVFLVSVVLIGTAVVDYGFVLDETETLYISKIYNFTWWFYLIVFTGRLILTWTEITRKTIFLTIMLGVMFYLSLIAKFVNVAETSSWFVIWNFLKSKYFIVALIGIFAVLNVSKGVVNFINKKTNPALLLVAGFALIIFFGTLLLLLPRSTIEHFRLPLADALFVSTSAVCVTGLSPVDLAHTFTLEGQIVIMLLIQIGGLGVMTITSFFALFFMGSTSLYNQFALRDMLGSDAFSSLISTLLNILIFTFTIEAIGALLIWISIHSTMNMTLNEEIFFSVFHAVSAFCNAGFSTLTGNLGNPAILYNHNWFYIIISILIILGGIGFPILVNFKNVLAFHIKSFCMKLFKKNYKQIRYQHLTNINTKIVIVTTSILIVFGTIIIAILEWNNAFVHMDIEDKIVQSFFNSVTPRTAGFNSVDLTNFSLLTIIVYSVLMWIGGGSQSTAGGIKVNTFAVAISNFFSVIRGKTSVTLFNRELSAESVRRASATIFGSLITIIVFFLILVAMEPEISPKGLLFETISAYCTVGSSLNITPLLADNSKIIVSVLMFIGRVSLITILMSVIQQKGNTKYRYPKDNVIIN
ncbi:MAG TPA: potassium transporter [Bacteroidetes bacterium]|nr:potassium transporter [Candidatus Limimorpha avicola]